MSDVKKQIHPFIWIFILLIMILLFVKTPIKKTIIINRMDTGKVVLGNSVEWKLVQLHCPFFEQLWKDRRQKENYEELVLNISPLYQYLLCQEAYFTDLSTIQGVSAETDLSEEPVSIEQTTELEEPVETENEIDAKEPVSIEQTAELEEPVETENEIDAKEPVSIEQTTELEEPVEMENATEAEETVGIENTADDSTTYEKAFEYNWEEYKNLEKVKEEFFTVDATTDIPLEKLNPAGFLEKDFVVEKGGDLPRILIYHTHSQEAYADSVAGEEEGSVVGLGDRLATLLQEKGFNVMHHKGQYDVECRDYAYSKALPAVESILEENPSIEVVIDIHRDAVSGKQKLISTQNGEDVAKLMFFNGLSYTKKQGKISYLENPYIEDNMAFSFQMCTLCNEYFPNSTRKIYLKGYRYNMHLRPMSLLVEVGAQTNTVDEAYRAMDILAQSLDLCLSPENAD